MQPIKYLKDNKLSKNQRASLIKKGKMPAKSSSSNIIANNTTTDSDSFMDNLQNRYALNLKLINDESSEFDYVKVALTEAEQIWANTQILIRTKDYATMTDVEKVSLIQKDFTEFYKNFPIVARYMICLGQYSMKAFKRMLIKCNETKKPEGEENTKDLNEKLWVDRQADYVRFLWEDCQTGTNFSVKQSNEIWQQTHDLLTEEFKQFKVLYSDAELKIKSDLIKHKKELLYEMSSRLVSGQQSLNSDAANSLLNKLKGKLFKQRFGIVIKQLDKFLIQPTHESIGINTFAKETYDDEIKQSFYKKNYKKMDLDKILSR